MMRQYELMLVVRPDFAYSDTKKVNELVKKTLGDVPATIKEVTVLGKKLLAYPIKKFTEGAYLLATVEAKTISVAQLQKQTQLGTDVIRFLLTAKEG